MSPYVFEVASSRLALGRCSFFVTGGFALRPKDNKQVMISCLIYLVFEDVGGVVVLLYENIAYWRQKQTIRTLQIAPKRPMGIWIRSYFVSLSLYVLAILIISIKGTGALPYSHPGARACGSYQF